MKFDKPKYLKLVEFIRANKGRVFALYTPEPQLEFSKYYTQLRIKNSWTLEITKQKAFF